MILAVPVGGLAAYLILTSSLENVEWKFSVSWPWWLRLAIAGLPVLSAWVFYRRVWTELSRGAWATLVTVRILATGALLLACFQPEMVFERVTYAKSSLIMMVDASKSMSVADTDATRFDRVRKVAGTLLPTLQRDFTVSLYTFAGGATRVEAKEEALGGVKPDGEATGIRRSLAQAIAEHKSETLAGVVVFTDGIDNSGKSLTRGLEELSARVFPVGVGSKLTDNQQFRDIIVSNIEGPRYAIVNNALEVNVYLKNIGYGNAVVKLALATDDGKTVAEQDVALATGAKEQRATLSFTPTQVGKLYLEAKVPVQADEKIPENNSQSIILSVINPKIKVLYVQGTVRPEYKWLIRALERDPNVEALSLVRVSGSRFQQQGRVADLELTGFPEDQKTLETFDVLILSDLDATFFTAQELENTRQAVREGKGFIMLGGDNSFGPGGYRGTPVEEILPVGMGTREMQKVAELFDLTLTAEGVHHPVFAGIADAFMSVERTPEHPLPQLKGFVEVEGAKPTATVLAVHPQRVLAGGQKLPILAAQAYGKGRAAAFTAYSTARWRSRPEVYLAFWGQLVRWLAQREIEEKSAGKGVIAGSDRLSYEPDSRVRVFAQARGEEGAPTNHAEVAAEVHPPSGRTEKLAMIFTPPADGNYEVSFEPGESGKYEVKVSASEGGAALGEATVTFQVGKPNLEYEELNLNDEELRKVASETGGRYYYLSNANELLLDLASKEQANRISGYLKLYHLPALFFVFVGLLTAEWILRRKWQLI
ncbi:MAG: glutamine amidotransferase [Planctomycetota bacterium]